MKRFRNLHTILLVFLLFSVQQIYGTKYYVATNGDNSDGLSWATAYTSIQTALDASVSGDEIWVKEGVYTPHSSDRGISITLKSGVKLYGSFKGDEVSIDDRPLSDTDGNGNVEKWEFSNPSKISGEIQNDTDLTNNTQHIIIIPNGVSAETLINGFIIEKGYSDTPSNTSYSSNTVFASGVIAEGGKISSVIVQECKTVASTISYGGGVFANNSAIENTLVKDCSINSKNCFGGGMFVASSVILNSTIQTCSVVPVDDIKGWGGGVYVSNSQIISSQIFNCSADGAQGYGGGAYMISSSAINSLLYNNEAALQGGGLFNFSSVFVNGLLANNKVTRTGSYGGGAYGNDASHFYNTVFWSNTTAGTSGQLKQVSGSVIMNCALDGETTGTNGINISSSNKGTETNALYPEFKSPTSFDGMSSGNSTYESQLKMADWNIEFTSDLMEKGYDNAFDEAFLTNSTGWAKVDLNADGDNFDKLESFIDCKNEYRKFNRAVDIGPNEAVFVTLTMPNNPNLEYGKSLGEITLTGGGVTDLRTNSNIAGAFSFVNQSIVPQFNNGVPEKYKVVFTPDDLVAYAVIYDSVEVTITAKELTLSGLSADDKVYDGTTNVTFSGTAILSGKVGTDDVSLSTGAISAAFENKHAGIDKNVIFNGYTLSGVDKGNYYLSLAGAQASITQLPVTVSQITANNKVYDGTTTATFTGIPTVSGKLGNDDVSVDASSAKGDFDNKNVGVDKDVTFSGFVLSGADGGNYSMSQPPNAKANITALEINVTGLDVENKNYDGTTKATLSGTPTVVDDAISGDDISLNINSLTANFSDKNVGTAKTVTIGGYFLTGADAPNYSIAQAADQTADIVAKELTITGLSATDKVYDGTTNVVVTGTASLQGVVSGDDIILNTNSISHSFADADAGDNKSINIAGYSISGSDVSNYTLAQPQVTATISKVQLAISANNITKSYNQADPPLTYAFISGALLSGDSFTGELSREVGEDVGVYAINQGTFSANSNYTLDFTPGSLTITKAENIISFELAKDMIVYGEATQINLSATSNSPNDVVFTSSDPLIASVSGNVLNIHKYGTITITASDAGTINYEPATSVERNFKVHLPINAIEKGSKILLIDNSGEQFSAYQWYRNGEELTGEQKQYYYSEEGLSGTYYCMVTTLIGEELKSNEVVKESLASMQIYPSPILKGTSFNVDFKGSKANEIKNSSIKVYSISGEFVYQVNNLSDINKLKIDKAGIYFIKTDGELQETQKIIVK